MTSSISFTIPQAAEATGVSTDIIRRAIKIEVVDSFPPPLKAKRLGAAGNAPYIILRDELERWAKSLPDA